MLEQHRLQQGAPLPGLGQGNEEGGDGISCMDAFTASAGSHSHSQFCRSLGQEDERCVARCKFRPQLAVVLLEFLFLMLARTKKVERSDA